MLEFKQIILEEVHDIQVNKLYRAEQEGLAKWHKPITKDNINSAVEKVYDNHDLIKKYGDAVQREIFVDHLPGKYSVKCAGGDENKITLPEWTREHGLHYVAHELAHSIHRRISGGMYYAPKGSHVTLHRGGQDHGSGYAGVFLNVVHAMLGPKAHASLKQSFDKHGVRYTNPREVLRGS